MTLPVGAEAAIVDPDGYFVTDPGIPFHLLKWKKAIQSGETGSTNQLTLNGLDDMFDKFSDKTIKDGLSSFLPHLPGYIDAPSTPDDSLQGLIDKPPVGGRELVPLTETSLQGFRLMPGSVPEQFKFLNKPPDKKKKKKHKRHDESEKNGMPFAGAVAERKHKKRKKEEGDRKKKEKKKKKKKDKKGETDEQAPS